MRLTACWVSVPKFRMLVVAAETSAADQAFADMPVPVDSGAARYRGIIEVDEVQTVAADHRVKLPYGFLKSLWGGKIVACSKSMGGIEAYADAGIFFDGRDNALQLPEIRADLIALACGVFDKQRDVGTHTQESAVEGVGDTAGCRRKVPVCTAARMDDKVIGTEQVCAPEVFRKKLN